MTGPVDFVVVTGRAVVLGSRYVFARLADFVCALVIWFLVSLWCRSMFFPVLRVWLEPPSTGFSEFDKIANCYNQTPVLPIIAALGVCSWPLFVGIYRLCKLSRHFLRFHYIAWLAVIIFATYSVGAKPSIARFGEINKILATPGDTHASFTDEDQRRLSENVNNVRRLELGLAQLEAASTVALLGLLVPAIGAALLRNSLANRRNIICWHKTDTGN